MTEVSMMAATSLQQEAVDAMRHLALMQNALREAELAEIEKVEKFAMASCRNLCDMVQAKLPRELRDQVYSHISTFDKVKVGNVLEPQSSPTEYSHHYWKAEFVGERTLLEIAENHFRTSRMHLSINEDQSWWDIGSPIKHFLTKDRMKIGHGFRPCDYVSKVELDFPHLNVCPYSGSWSASEEFMEEAENLFSLKTGATMCFNICTDPVYYHCGDDMLDSQIQRTMSRSVELLFPIVLRLKDAGYDVNVYVHMMFDGDLQISYFVPKEPDFSVESCLAKSKEILKKASNSWRDWRSGVSEDECFANAYPELEMQLTREMSACHAKVGKARKGW